MYILRSEVLMVVAICDDDSLFRTELKTLIIEYKQSKRIAVDVYEFENGNDLLESKDIFDIIFIDYQMPGLDGLETARELRKRNYICSIIFITSYPQFILDSFEVQPFRFFIKPMKNNKILSAMDSYLMQQKLLNPILIVEEGTQYRIKTEDIIYLEAIGKNCLIRTREHTYKSSKTLSKIEEVLPTHCFYRIHKSYIVNMYCIDSISKNEILMINGEKTIISRTMLSTFKKTYSNFIKNFYLKV